MKALLRARTVSSNRNSNHQRNIHARNYNTQQKICSTKSLNALKLKNSGYNQLRTNNKPVTALASRPRNQHQNVIYNYNQVRHSGALASMLGSNPYFSAGTGLMAIGMALALGRVVGKQAVYHLKRRLLTTLEIPSQDKSFHWILAWLSRQGVLDEQSFWGSNQLSLQTHYKQHENGETSTHFEFLPSVGTHYFRYAGRLIQVNRHREKNLVDVTTGIAWENLTLTTVGGKEVFLRLIEEAKAAALAKEEGSTVIYVSGGGDWRRFGHPRRRRPLASVVLDAGVSEKIVSDVKNFLHSAGWYLQRGIPYRRGYLLYGPPGCGKSSFITALAGELQLNICILNLASRGITDDSLNYLLTAAPQRSIILLEDLDAVIAKRHEAQPYTVTFSGLLNALDGVAATEGRILFMTTNYKERLDHALIRPGRVDVIEQLDNASHSQIKNLCLRFFPEREDVADELVKNLPDRAISVATLQNYFMNYKDDPAGLLRDTHLLQPSPIPTSTTPSPASVTTSSAVPLSKAS